MLQRKRAGTLELSEDRLTQSPSFKTIITDFLAGDELEATFKAGQPVCTLRRMALSFVYNKNPVAVRLQKIEHAPDSVAVIINNCFHLVFKQKEENQLIKLSTAYLDTTTKFEHFMMQLSSNDLSKNVYETLVEADSLSEGFYLRDNNGQIIATYTFGKNIQLVMHEKQPYLFFMERDANKKRSSKTYCICESGKIECIDKVIDITQCTTAAERKLVARALSVYLKQHPELSADKGEFINSNRGVLVVTEANKLISVKLPYSIILRKNKKGKPIFEFVDRNKELGSGSYGSVCEVMTVALTDEQNPEDFMIKTRRTASDIANGKRSNRRLAKIITAPKIKNTSVDPIKNEYDLSTIYTALNVKQLTMVNKHKAVMIMHHFEWGDLYKYLAFIENLADTQEYQTRILKLITQLWSALEQLHKKAKIVHLDIKPENIFIDSDGTPYFGDFGLSRKKDEKDWHNGGSPAYMRKAYLEQVLAKGVGNRSEVDDIYAVAIVMAIVLGAEPPTTLLSDALPSFKDKMIALKDKLDTYLVSNEKSMQVAFQDATEVAFNEKIFEFLQELVSGQVNTAEEAGQKFKAIITNYKPGMLSELYGEAQHQMSKASTATVDSRNIQKSKVSVPAGGYASADCLLFSSSACSTQKNDNNSQLLASSGIQLKA